MASKKEIDKYISELAWDDLLALKESVDKRVTDERDKEKNKLKEDFEALLAKKGFNVTDFYDLGGGKQRRSSGANGEIRQRAPAKPKYISPDGKETYSGRGRAPRWMVAACKVDSWEEVTPKMKEKFLIKE